MGGELPFSQEKEEWIEQEQEQGRRNWEEEGEGNYGCDVKEAKTANKQTNKT